MSELKSIIEQHGLTVKQYKDLVAKGCAICKTTSFEAAPRKLTRKICFGAGPHIDHNPRCCTGKYGCPKCFRGILCGRCKAIIYYIKDDVKILRKLDTIIKRIRKCKHNH